MYSSYDLWLQKANNENSIKANQGSDVSSFPHNQPTNKDKLEVCLFSANPRNGNKVVVIGSLASQDKTFVVRGNMLRDEFHAVLIKIIMPRPYKDIRTVRDALDHLSRGLGSMSNGGNLAQTRQVTSWLILEVNRIKMKMEGDRASLSS